MYQENQIRGTFSDVAERNAKMQAAACGVLGGGAPKQAPIDRAIVEIGVALDRLLGEIAVLNKQLDPVLQPHPENCAAEEGRPASCDIENRLMSLSRVANQCLNAVTGIRQRLCV